MRRYRYCTYVGDLTHVGEAAIDTPPFEAFGVGSDGETIDKNARAKREHSYIADFIMHVPNARYYHS